MPERQRGRDPNRFTRKEQEHAPSFHQAARYPDEQSSETPYDLSIYRLRLGHNLVWHVAVLGSPPPEDLQRRIEEILSTGEPVTLPDDILTHLVQRRAEQSGRG